MQWFWHTASHFCTRGGIGRHVRFRFLCREVWGFKSLRVHHSFSFRHCPLRLSARTSGSHPGKRGSTPLGGAHIRPGTRIRFRFSVSIGAESPQTVRRRRRELGVAAGMRLRVPVPVPAPVQAPAPAAPRQPEPPHGGLAPARTFSNRLQLQPTFCL